MVILFNIVFTLCRLTASTDLKTYEVILLDGGHMTSLASPQTSCGAEKVRKAVRVQVWPVGGEETRKNGKKS